MSPPLINTETQSKISIDHLSSKDQIQQSQFHIDEDEEKEEDITIVSKLFESSEEQLIPINGKVFGKIPLELNGIFLRVGPGKFDLPSGYTMNHYFDGYALISKYTFQNGVVSYESKFLNSDAFNKGMATGKPLLNEFGSKSEQDMGKTYFQKMCRIASLIMVPNLTDNCNYAVVTQDQDTFVMGEISSFHELDVSSLKSIFRHDMPKYFGFYQFTPHPLKDYNTGDTWNIGTSVKTGLKYNLVKIPPKSHSNISCKEHFKKNLKIIASIPSRWSTWIGCAHSFGMSENYAVFVEQPHILNVGRYIAHGLVRNEPYKIWLEWHPDYPVRFYIINKKTGKILPHEYLSSQIFYFIHIINCYEDNNELIIDISTYDDPSVLDNQVLFKLRNECSWYDQHFQASIKRFVIPLHPKNEKQGINLVTNGIAVRQDKSILISPHQIVSKGLEMLILNPKYTGKPYQYAYGTSLTALSSFSKAIVKVNVQTGETLKWSAGKNSIYGEAVFIPKANEDDVVSKNEHLLQVNSETNNNNNWEEDEDDGFLIVPSMDIRKSHQDYLYILDAKTMKNISQITFGKRIPPAFHGKFLSSTTS